MTITRVIRDDVEFFTNDATGESGMSESGLARLCGVTAMAVNIAVAPWHMVSAGVVMVTDFCRTVLTT